MYAQISQQELERRVYEEAAYRKTLSGMSQRLGLDIVRCDARQMELETLHQTASWAENVNGTVHGGIIAAVLDSTMGILCHCCLWPRRGPTINLNINYLRPVHIGDALHTRARLLRRGRNLLWFQALSWVESPDKPCASAEGTFYLPQES